MPLGKAAVELRSKVENARDASAHNDHMTNLAYVVSSANENIQALQQTVKQQEKELAQSADHSAALQRNYETLARIRRADQEEFLILKKQQAEERERMQQLQADLDAERKTLAEQGEKLQAAAAAEAQIQVLNLQLVETTHARDELSAEVTKLRTTNSELIDQSRVLKVNVDKLSRAQQEMLTKARKADETIQTLESEKDAAEKTAAAASSKCVVQERQLKTFLQANEALEADLRKQLSRVAQLERRKQEMEAEQQTVEAYYQARLEEMQSQYDRLLSEIDDAKRHAQEKVYRKFDDNAPVVPSEDQATNGNA